MKYRGFYSAAAATLVACWAIYWLAGASLAHRVAARFGDKLLRLSHGKFNDASIFVQHRLREGLLLTTLVLAWVAAQALLDRFLRHRPARARYRWAVHGLAGFAFLNLWLAVAVNTALFWGIMGIGGGVENQIQFHFKRILLEENRTPRRAVLVGNSQTRAEIDMDLLNSLLGTSLWTTELHFPGCHAYDLLLVERQIRRADPQIVICYLSEGYFYQGSHGETPPVFLGVSDLPEAFHLGAQHYLDRDEIGYGLLGDVLPLFRCRRVFVHRLFGSATAALKQHEYDTALKPDLEARAREQAKGVRLSAESEFQQRAFEEFVARCTRAHRRMIFLEGGYNPILARQIDPAVRADMRSFLQELQRRYSKVTVIPWESLPEQTPSDYEDLSHVNKDMRARFTRFLASVLEALSPEKTK